MAEQLFRIPLLSVPQRFNITLGGRQLIMVNKWNESCGWVIDIYDGVTGEPLIMMVPLVIGANLLEQYEYVGIPGEFIMYTDGNKYQEATEINLGSESNLYYIVEVA